MKAMDDKAQNDILSALILVMVMIVAIAFMIMLGGTFLDAFVFKFSQIVVLNGIWLDMFTGELNTISYFYKSLIFFLGILILWVFKLIYENMEYSKQQQGGYDYKYWK